MIRFQRRIFAVVLGVCVLIGVPIVAVASATCEPYLPFDLEMEEAEEEGGGTALMLVGQEKTAVIHNPNKDRDGDIKKEDLSDKTVLEFTGKSCVGIIKAGATCKTQKIKCLKVGKADWVVTAEPADLSSKLTIECHEKKEGFLSLLVGPVGLSWLE